MPLKSWASDKMFNGIRKGLVFLFPNKSQKHLIVCIGSLTTKL